MSSPKFVKVLFKSWDIKPAIVISYLVGSLGISYLSHLLDKVLISSALFGEIIHSLVIADPKSDIPSFVVFPSVVTHNYRFSVLCPALLIECKASCLVMLNRLMRYISKSLPVSSVLFSVISIK